MAQGPSMQTPNFHPAIGPDICTFDLWYFPPGYFNAEKNGLGESRAIMVYFRTRICAYPSFGCLYQTGRRTCPLCPLVQPFCLGHVSSFQSRYGTGM